MYTIPAALATIDSNTSWVIFFSACGWISGTVQFFEGLRLTWRDKVIGLPLGYVCIILAHDANFFLHYDFWFHTVNHWYFNYTVYLFAAWPVIEIASILWLVQVARREIAPQFPAPAFYGVYGLFQVTAIVLYLLLMSWIDDPLHLMGITISQVINILFMIPMALRRGSTRGQSRLMAWTLLLGPASTAMLLPPSIASGMLTTLYWAAIACTTALSVAYLLIFEYYRRQENAVDGMWDRLQEKPLS